MDMLSELVEELGGAPARITLPLASRNPGRLARRLSFTRGHGYYWIILCRGLSCRACGFREEPIVRVERIREKDILSGLSHPVPRLVVECCGRVVGVGEWRGSRIVLEDLECDVNVKPASVECGGRECRISLAECLRECSG